MSVLIIQHLDKVRGLPLGGRVVIGRRPFCTVLIPDPLVSRIHCWIKPAPTGATLFDSGSRGGTTVNGQRIEKSVDLQDGDVIQIGPATLTWLAIDALPVDIQPVEPPVALPTTDLFDGGIYFDCNCGGPMWVTADLAGATGRCRYCSQKLIVPHHSGHTARPALPAGASPLKSAARPQALGRPQPIDIPKVMVSLCSICQSPIHPAEEKTSCPTCQLTFHKQCWEENKGCSAYGCNMVNVLAPPDEQTENLQPLAEAAQPLAHFSESELHAVPVSGFPYDLLLIALSFVAMGLSALAFGIPSAMMLIWSVAYLGRGGKGRKLLLVGSILISLLGMALGYATSMFFYKQVKIWEGWLR